MRLLSRRDLNSSTGSAATATPALAATIVTRSSFARAAKPITAVLLSNRSAKASAICPV